MRIFGVLSVVALGFALSGTAHAQTGACPPGPGLEARVACLEQTVAALQSQLAGKVDKTYVDQQIKTLTGLLGAKADTTYVDKHIAETVGKIPNLDRVKIEWTPYWMPDRKQCLFFDNENKSLLAETCDHDREEYVRIRP